MVPFRIRKFKHHLCALHWKLFVKPFHLFKLKLAEATVISNEFSQGSGPFSFRISCNTIEPFANGRLAWRKGFILTSLRLFLRPILCIRSLMAHHRRAIWSKLKYIHDSWPMVWLTIHLESDPDQFDLPLEPFVESVQPCRESWW